MQLSLAMRLLFGPRCVRRVLNLPARNYIISTWQRPAIAMEPLALWNHSLLGRGLDTEDGRLLHDWVSDRNSTIARKAAIDTSP
jgi:hypothetical protein